MYSHFYPVETNHFLPIHREAPAFVEQATEQQILVTGIKVLYFIISLSMLDISCNI
jgi:F0F1-type ATP synthase beta subunit